MMFRGHLDYFQKPPLKSRSNTKPGEATALRILITIDLFYIYHGWGPAWIKFIEITFCWGPVTYDCMIRDHTTTWFGRCLGWPLDTFFWARRISWSRLLARVWSGPKVRLCSPHSTKCIRLRTLPFKLNYDTPSPMKSIMSPILVHFQGPRSGHFHLSSWILQSGTWDMLGIWHYVLRYGGHKRKNEGRVDQNKSSKNVEVSIRQCKEEFLISFCCESWMIILKWKHYTVYGI